MADEIRKVPEEIKEDIEKAQEGAIPDDAAEAVAGGLPRQEGYRMGYRTGVHANANGNR